MAKKKAKSKPETLHDPSTFGARHDAAWQKSFITPIAREMKKRGVAYLLITIRDDGKAVFVIEPNGMDEGRRTQDSEFTNQPL